MLLGSFSKTYTGYMVPIGGKSLSTALFTDTKGNVTYRFSGSDASLLESIAYDDFGTPTITTIQSGDSTLDRTSTYESKRLDKTTGLLDFGSRWYDPLVGRFTTPDEILGVKFLARTDGLNRLAFENNDPINHSDPTGHWSFSAIMGAALGAVLVVGAIAVTIATGGLTTPLVAAAVGGLASGGVAGISYSFDHRNERGGKFWGGYAATVLVNAAIGAASGYLGAVATPAHVASATGRPGQVAGRSLTTATVNSVGKAASVGGQALVGATSSLLTTVSHNFIENSFYGTNHGLFEGAAMAALTGSAIGLASGGWSAWRYKGESIAATQAGSKTGSALGTLKNAGNGSWAVAKGEHLDEKAEQGAASWYHKHESAIKFTAMEVMLGVSGLAGQLHKELQMNQSCVNYG